ncbi:PQQ-dependent sugar dehydrogenase [Actinophytocola glycyrrhizae]|uniref:PQQ-dependent sugar dehydrogenase n=1 Tax=Actinophytocola glycyrrhizae TaxID=2044873 RepID=A0ABV9SBS6_9PSEU
MSKPRRWLVAIAGAVVAAGLVVPPGAVAQADEPIQDPLPDPVPSSLGLTVAEFAQFPKTELTPPPPDPPPDLRLIRHARINHLGEVPDGSGRLYVPDLNGRVYLAHRDTPGTQHVYVDFKARFPDFFSGRGLGSGSGFVTFHPDFKRNGKFYTVHTENGAALSKPTTWPSHSANPFLHSIITEWTASDPSANTFSGTRREVLRIAEARQVHAIQQIDFNPNARKGSRDYGILYVASGDGGAGATTTEPQQLSNPYGKILRIDPLGSNGTGGQFGIPADNPFVGTPGALAEIYAIGMRDPHRFSWDAATGRMYLGHIGEHRIEAVYEVRAGDNYGWSEREGRFVYKRNDPQCSVYPLPPDDARYGYDYPVAAFDHNPPPGHPLCSDSGHAISGGFVYRGAIPELRGKYVFTDLVDGRIFYTEASEMRRGRPAARIHQLQVYANGQRTDFQELVGDDRVDLRFGQDARGELYLVAKADGKVYKVTGAKRFASCKVGHTRVTGSGGADSWSPVTPDKWRFRGGDVILAQAGEARPGPRRPFEYAVLDKGPELSSVRVDTKVRLDTPVEVTNRDVVVVFGYQSDTEFYYAHVSTDNTIYPHNGIFVVADADRLRIDDQWNEVMSRGAPPAITDTAWHDVSVTHCADTGEISVRVDGELLMTAVDHTFGSGRTGFGSFDNIGRARDFRVTGTAA